MKHFNKIAFGALMGTFFGVLIPIFVSIGIGDGNFYYCAAGNDLGYCILNFVVMCLFGIYCTYSSYIFDIKNLKLIWKYVIHILVLLVGIALTGLAVGWFTYYIGFVWAIGSFVVIYVVIGLINYFQSKANIGKINDKLNDK